MCLYRYVYVHIYEIYGYIYIHEGRALRVQGFGAQSRTPSWIASWTFVCSPSLSTRSKREHHQGSKVLYLNMALAVSFFTVLYHFYRIRP